MITRPVRTLALALLALAACVGVRHAAGAAERPPVTLSTAFDQYAEGDHGGFTMRQQGVYVVGDVTAPSLVDLVPAALGLDAVDVEPDGGVLFSTRHGGLVRHDGGLIELVDDRVYRVLPNSRVIEPVRDWSERGIAIDSLDALDRLGDGRLAFSTAHHRFVVHAGGSLTLRPEDVYVYDPRHGTIERLLDGVALGLSNVDALHVAGDGVVACSLATDRQVATPDGPVWLRHEDVVLVDGDAVAAWVRGAERGLQSLDALSLPGARASGGLLLVPERQHAIVEEGDPDVVATYFVTLTRRPSRSTTIDLSSPDRQLGCAPDRIGFTPYDWLLPWSIRVHALDDDTAERPLHRGTIAHAAVAGDARWTGAELPTMRFGIVDDEHAAGDEAPADAYLADGVIELDRSAPVSRPATRRPQRHTDRERPASRRPR